MGTGKSKFISIQMDRCPFTFLQCQMHYILYIGVDTPGSRIYSQQEIGQVGVGTSKSLSGNVDGACFVEGMVAREGSCQVVRAHGQRRMLVRIWQKLGSLQTMKVVEFFRM